MKEYFAISGRLSLSESLSQTLSPHHLVGEFLRMRKIDKVSDKACDKGRGEQVST
jgi:hypothetical protein